MDQKRVERFQAKASGRRDRPGSGVRDCQIFDAGEIVEAEPPRRLVIHRQHQNARSSRLKAIRDARWNWNRVATRSNSASHTLSSANPQSSSRRWPAAGRRSSPNLKSLLETGATALSRCRRGSNPPASGARSRRSPGRRIPRQQPVRPKRPMLKPIDGGRLCTRLRYSAAPPELPRLRCSLTQGPHRLTTGLS